MLRHNNVLLAVESNNRNWQMHREGGLQNQLDSASHLYCK